MYVCMCSSYSVFLCMCLHVVRQVCMRAFGVCIVNFLTACLLNRKVVLHMHGSHTFMRNIFYQQTIHMFIVKSSYLDMAKN